MTYKIMIKISVAIGSSKSVHFAVVHHGRVTRNISTRSADFPHSSRNIHNNNITLLHAKRIKIAQKTKNKNEKIK